MSDSTAHIHKLVVDTLERTGYRPFGHDGSAWEHPNGTRVTTGYTGGQLRVRRFVPGNTRFTKIPPITWDIRAVPDESQIAEFVGQPGPAPELTAEEAARVAEFDLADDAPESFRQQLINALGDEMDALGMSPGRFYAPALADAALRAFRGEF